MDYQDESLEFDTQRSRNNLRPAFLLVICILSWISSGWNVFGAVSELTTSVEDLEKEAKITIHEAEKSSDGSEAFDVVIDQTTSFMMTRVKTTKVRNYSYLLLYLIQGLAIYLMFQLKKIGFWVYLGVQVGVLITIATSYPWPNFMTTLTFVYILFTSLLFTTLFGVNVKHMKN